jgi:hypothetical protein
MYIHTYMQMYVHTYIHANVCTYRHANVCMYVHLNIVGPKKNRKTATWIRPRFSFEPQRVSLLLLPQSKVAQLQLQCPNDDFGQGDQIGRIFTSWVIVFYVFASPLWPSIFSNYSFLVHLPVNWDDRHLLAHAMDSDFTVTLMGDCFWSATPCALLLLGPPFFPLFFLVHHPVNCDDLHLLAHAMASDFTVALMGDSHFIPQLRLCINFDKNCVLGYFLGHFFKSSSGRPDFGQLRLLETAEHPFRERSGHRNVRSRG